MTSSYKLSFLIRLDDCFRLLMFLGTYNITDLKVALKTNRFIFHLIFLNLFSFLNSVGQDKDADSRFFLRSWQAHYYKSQ